MSTATAAPPADAAPPRAPKKKLLLIIGAAVLALAVVAAGGVVFLKHRAAAAEAAAAEDDSDAPAPTEVVVRRDPKAMPTFVPLDPFTVNLADRDAERYAQVGISLELADPKEADRIKVFMPVIRNNILMVLAHKSSTELLERDGKTRLAQEIRRETARALGVEIADAQTGPATAGDDKATKKARAATAEPLPIAAVHFSNFIIQ